MTPQQANLIDWVKAWSVDMEGVEALFLGGSFGKGNADIWSDIDFVMVTGDDERGAIADALLGSLESWRPLLHRNRIDMGAILINLIFDDWTRADFLLVGRDGLGHRGQDSLAALHDPEDLRSRLPETVEWPGPNPQKITQIVTEGIRILGLMPVVHGRDEVVVGVTGVELFRGQLLALMMETVPLVDKGGALHLSRLLPEDRLAALAGLPAVEATWESVFAAHRALAEIFFPLARQVAAECGATWPDAFEAGTRAHLKQSLNFTFA